MCSSYNFDCHAQETRAPETADPAGGPEEGRRRLSGCFEGCGQQAEVESKEDDLTITVKPSTFWRAVLLIKLILQSEAASEVPADVAVRTVILVFACLEGAQARGPLGASAPRGAGPDASRSP